MVSRIVKLIVILDVERSISRGVLKGALPCAGKSDLPKVLVNVDERRKERRDEGGN